MKGYKAFNKDLTCIGYQYELNKTHIFYDVPMLCEKGFHFCTELQDIVNYYCSFKMRVFEIEASGIITHAKSDCSKRACSKIKLIRELSFYEVAQSITKSYLAYLWAMNIGNRDIMIDVIKNSEYAYWWARNIGNQDIMIDKVTESEWAYFWALSIGNNNIMIDKITESKWAFTWANNIGNQNIMIDKVTESEWAYFWAIDIGNKDVMIDKINDINVIAKWLMKWPEDKQYFIDKGLI